MTRQVVLDTETTGLEIREGHRIIEIGCIELVNRRITGRTYHQYINPEREIELGAEQVHGLTNDFLQDKPKFVDIVEVFLRFIDGAELIIHNAAFDVGFINHEFKLLERGVGRLEDCCSIIDTLQMARKLHPGQRNSLDALCKRYGVDNSNRDLHGGLLDAELLGFVYLAMTSGQDSLFTTEVQRQAESKQTSEDMMVRANQQQKFKLTIIKANTQELNDHELYLDQIENQSGHVLWRD